MTTFYKSLILSLMLLLYLVSITYTQPLKLGDVPNGMNAGFGISPVDLSIQTKPGARTSTSFTITNFTKSKNVKFIIETLELGQNESGLTYPVQTGFGTLSCVDWLNVSTEILINGGASKEIPIDIFCPGGSVGAYYAILKVSIEPSKKEAQYRVAVRPTIAVTLEVIVTGGFGAAHIEPKEIIYEAGSYPSTPSLFLNIKNGGAWKVPVEGDVLIYSNNRGFPQRISIPFKDGGIPYEIYPNMSLKLKCFLAERLEPGNHRISARLQAYGRTFALKEFTINVPKNLYGTSSINAKEGAKVELDVDLDIKPKLLETVLPTGGTRTLAISVRNNDSRNVNIISEIAHARMEKSGVLTYAELEQQDSLDWLTVSPDSISLYPKQSTVLRIKAAFLETDSISLPARAIVIIRAKAKTMDARDNWTSGGEFPVVVMVQAPKMSPAKLEISKFEILRSSLKNNPSAAVLCVKNVGGKIAQISGRIIMEMSTGQEILHMNIGDNEPELLFPDAEREFRLPLGPLHGGDYNVRANLVVLDRNRIPLKSELSFTVYEEDLVSSN